MGRTMMILTTKKMKEMIMIGKNIKLSIIDVINCSAKLAIQAPPVVSVFRKEIYRRKGNKLEIYYEENSKQKAKDVVQTDF